MSERQKTWGVLALWTGLWALFFATLLLGREYLAQSDLLSQFHTFGRFQAQEMLAGRLPLWSPGSYAGFPFAADTQAAVFYLPRWLTIFLSAPWSFPYYALEVEGLLHIWLLGVFTYFLAYDITQNRWSGLIAAVTFGLGGFVTSYPLLQLALLETVAWLPLVLLLLRRGLRQAQSPLPWMVGAGLVLGFSFLAGHPQTFLHISYLAAFYFVFLALRARWQWRWLLILGGVVAVTAVGLSAAAWLPALRYTLVSTRSDVGYEFVAKGFALLDYVQLWLPGPFTGWVSMYVGLPALALALLAWLLPRQADLPDARAEILFWTGVAALTLILSLGDKGILFELVYRVAPGFSLFRQQERIVSLFSLSLALLAALGLAGWQNAPEPTRQQGLRRLLWLLVGGLLFCGFLLTAVKKTEWFWLWWQQGVITAVTLLLLWSRKGAAWRSLALILLLCLDLFLLSRQQLNYQAGSPTIFWPQPDWLTTLQEDAPGRLETQGFFLANVGELHGLQDVRGISPLRPQSLAKLDELSPETRWRLLNVTHVVAAEPFVESLVAVAPVNSSVFPDQPVAATLYRYENSLPRAWMVYDAQAVETDEAAFARLQQPEFDPANEVVLTRLSGEITGVAPPAAPPTVTLTQTNASQRHIQVSTGAPGVLVISEWAYPGWQATVNGETWPLETADYALQALILPAGSYEIVLRFSPWDVKVGTAVSLLTLLAALVLAWRWQPIPALRPAASRFHLPKLNMTTPGLNTTLQKKQWLMLAVGIFWLAFGLRVFHLGDQELRGDEAFSYLFARLPIAEITPALIAEGDPHSPLHYLLLHGWLALGGDSEFALRYLSALSGLLLLPLLFQLGRLLGGRRLGLLAAFWLALSSLLIWLSQDVRNQYMLTLLFSLLATVILVWKLVDAGAGTAERDGMKRNWYWAVYILAAALAVYSHYYGLFILAAHGLYVLGTGGNGRLRKLGAWLLAGTMAGLLFLPWAVTVLRGLLAAGQLSDPSKPELAQYLAEIGVALTSGSAVADWWPRWLFVAALLVVTLGALWLFKQKPAWGLLLGGWLATAVLLIYLIRFSRATFNSFYISVAAPAWWLLFSVGLLLLRRQRWRGWRVAAALAALMVMAANGIGLRNYYFDPAYSRSNGYREAAAEISAHARPGDLFLAQFPDPVWGYYLRHTGLPTAMQPTSPQAAQAETEQALQRLADAYDRLWFAPYPSETWDAENIVGRWLDYHLLHERHTPYQNQQLWAFRPLRTANEAATLVNALLNGEILLEAAYVTVNGRSVPLDQSLTVSPGDAVSVSLIWSADEALAEDYTVFVHLLAEDGSLLAQHDGAPMFGTRPTTTWNRGEQLLDRHELVVAEPGVGGNGRLLIGMYRPDALERLPWENGETAWTVNSGQ